MKKIFILLCFVLSYIGMSGQGIRFFEGNYDAALAQAAKESKIVFIDFYADWCGPCKAMAKEVFTDSLIGDYFNRKIIALQINTEKKENKDIVKKYKVSAMPTLAFIQPAGKLISISAGARDQQGLLKMAKVATGDALSFEKLYEKHKSTPEDVVTTRELLKEAPDYVGSLEGIDAQKWITRINKVYKDYIARQLKNDTALINAEDYRICYKFNQMKPNDPLMEYINSHIQAYMDKLGNAPAAWVIEYNSKNMENYAKAGNEEYKKLLERIRGDMKLAYSIAPVGNIPTYEKFKYYYDGLYILYHDKDVNTYISHTNNYLNAMGEQAGAEDYGQASQNMYYATKGKLPAEAHLQGEQWLIKALQFPDVTLIDKINMLTMLGDTKKAQNKFKEAKEAYNQAYMESLQVTQKMTAATLQMAIKRKLSALELAQ